MADQFRIDPAEVRAVADGLAGLSARMTGHVSGLGAQVSAAGAPWGSDATGDQFAGGPDGLVAHMQQSLQAMAARAETVQRHADRLATAAGFFELADQA
ncbi:WXG100 family type VII secretion target [Mycobacterium heidelbergense]|uniref:WXG100 family type VII secretion target n=1 Tax=Mycobacterium heidelbergense TaxID=53376 RepID=UPI003CE9EAE2